MRLKDVKKKNNLTILGVFLSSLFITVVAVYFYSPVSESNAVTGRTVDVTTNVRTIISVTLDKSELNYNMMPTASGVFESKSLTASIETNATGGYEMYFSAKTNETALVHENESISNKVTSSFSGTVTSESMNINTWGYSLSETDFSNIPLASSPAIIKNLDHRPSAAETDTTVNIGIKIASNLPSGKYSNSVVFSALAHDTKIQTMQEFVCDAETPLERSITLRDARDDNLYTVRKMKDGNCWMTQNLRLLGVTITKEDSDIPMDSYDVPGNNWGDSLDPTDKFYYPYAFDAHNHNYGILYNYVAVTAGEITGEENDVEATQSICPKGWKMPSADEYADLLRLYGVTNDAEGSATMQSAPLSFIYSGYIEPFSNYEISNGLYGSFITTTPSESHRRWDAYLGNEYAAAGWGNPRNFGTSLRCLVRL